MEFTDNQAKNQPFPVSFTIYRSASGTLSKKYDLGADGRILKTPAAQMTTGTAERVTMDFSAFGSALSDADAKTAFGYGLHDEAFGALVKITVSSKEKESERVLSRSQRYFQYRAGPGVVMNDHDPHSRGPSVTPTEVQTIITNIFPGFANAATWTRGSLSSGVHRAGEEPQSVRGVHLYNPVPDTSDIPRFGDVLFKQLWLAGYGYIAISAAGTFLVRSILDSTVYKPERLDFTGKPTVGTGLTWTPPEIVYREGGYLDTRMLPDLTLDEERRFNELVTEAKAKAEPERAVIRKAWLERQVKRMVERGVSEERARRALRRIADDGARFDVYADFILDFANRGPVTVGDILKNGEEFNCKALADPFEGRDYGPSTATFYANKETGRPCINSQAHGGMIYYLCDAIAPSRGDAVSRIEGESQGGQDWDIRQWPILSHKAASGIAGDFVELATRNSEADPAAVLATFLVRAGIEFGTRPHLMVGDARHCARLNAVIVGNSSKSRKGTSAKPVLRLFSLNSLFSEYKSAKEAPGPLSSGEGLIYAVRDPVQNWQVEKKTGHGKWITSDPGVDDKRLFVLDEELAAALKCTRREGNTLSTVIRTAFDDGNLAPLTKSNRITATGAHIGIVSHITTAELHRLLDETEALNGFANRFLWICARRQKLVPFPEPMPEAELMKIQRELVQILDAVKSIGLVSLNNAAHDYWVDVYGRLSAEQPGLVGCIVNRAEAIVLRLALIYSLLSVSNTIQLEHIESALGMWEYARESAEYIFSCREANPIAQKILEAVEKGPVALTDISKVLSNHATRSQLQTAIQELLAAGKVEVEDEKTPGRPKTIISLAKKAKEAKKGCPSRPEPTEPPVEPPDETSEIVAGVFSANRGDLALDDMEVI